MLSWVRNYVATEQIQAAQHSRRMEIASRIRAIPLSTNSAKVFNSLIETCSSLLKDFTSRGSFRESRALHAVILKRGLSSERFVAVKLLIMYLKKSRNSSDAAEMIKEFDGSDTLVSNCLISANLDWGNLEEARQLFDKMPHRNEISWTALISGFMKHGKFDEAMWYFQRNPFHNVVSWTAMISGFVQNGLSSDAMWIFRRMLRSGYMPNAVTFTSVVRACVGLRGCGLSMSLFGLAIKAGLEDNVSVLNSLITLSSKVGEADTARQVFDSMGTRDIVSWTAILDMYAEMGDLREARRIFEEMPHRNEVSWSAMIARHSQSGYPEESLELFQRMIRKGFKPNSSCLSSAMSTLATLKALHAGMNLQGYVNKLGLDHDVFISSSLIDLYCKCGRIQEGRLVFDSCPNRNVVSWNSLVTGYCMNGLLTEAKDLFKLIPERNKVSWNALIAGYMENEMFSEVFQMFNEMLLSGEMPNHTTFSSLFSACAATAALETGKNLHGKVIKQNMHTDVIVETALLNMYAKSGDIESARLVFYLMPEKNEISWTVMIQGLAENGLAEESIRLFEEMQKNTCVAPNEPMLLAVLFACAHCGLVDKGMFYFNSMERVYGIKPKIQHYTCVVDLLSRSGQLAEAENLIKSMPLAPNSDMWASLISGCNVYGRKDIAERVGSELLEKNQGDGYVALSNLYASFGNWIDVSKTRRLMKERKLKKMEGCSWVGIRNRIHTFYPENGSRLHSDDVYHTLELLRYGLPAL